MKENQLVEIKDLFNVSRWFKPDPVASKPISERAMLLGWFAEKTSIEIGHVAFMVGHLKDLKDLYYLQSDMKQAHARGVLYSASFRSALTPKK